MIIYALLRIECAIINLIVLQDNISSLQGIVAIYGKFKA
jgi:hypothetical protein